MSNNITFVTSYIKIYNEEYDINKIFQKRLDLFLKLAETGINICIFTSIEFKEIFEDICTKYKNIKLLDVISISELQFSNINTTILELPERRSHIKDTINYMYLMNSKIEFVKKTIDINPFSTKYFAWFDFSLPYIFKNINKSIEKIKNLPYHNYINSFLTIPGCWDYKVNDISLIGNNICWRFCGGFFFGDKESLIYFYNLSIDNFNTFLTQTHKLVWEVNYWAWLESNTNFKPIWYLANHDDSIINISHHLHESINLANFADQIIVYDYPKLYIENDNFFPSSASYIYDKINKKHLLNTRYVNYYYKDNWDCIFFNNTGQIKTINIFSKLNDQFEPVSFNIINIDETNLYINNNSFSIGLEDIRLYNDNNTIKYIASNINYNNQCKNRMMIGDYNYENNVCSNNLNINMLWESKCEKNWAPIDFNNELNRKLFIYKWSPYQVGFIDDENNFHIYIEYSFNDELVNKFRGSTTFIEKDDNTLIGLVHYSIHNIPPIYYHCVVLIDKLSLLPIKYSDPFKFKNQPIEFCTGFTIKDNKYLFWISQMDREPLFIKIDIDKIPILNEVI
jgi:hypothetical protein